MTREQQDKTFHIVETLHRVLIEEIAGAFPPLTRMDPREMNRQVLRDQHEDWVRKTRATVGLGE